MQKVRFWTDGVPVEHAAMRQLEAVAALPIVAGHVAAMPDIHHGKGATVGSVIPTRGAIIPAAVGVDIGCGMLAVRTALTANDLPDSLAALRSAIEAAVPVGFHCHEEPVRTFHDGLEGIALHHRMQGLRARYDRLAIAAHIGALREPDKVWRQIGSVGGGNHFQELCLDEHDRVWIMLHTGSRNIGKVIGETGMRLAREHMKCVGYPLPDEDLAWLDEGTVAFDAYIEAMRWAQDYAALNRDSILHLMLRVLRKIFGERFSTVGTVINCHHNFSDLEEHGGERFWVTRKGAIQAREGQLGIIPGSMGAKSFIVRGKGCAAAYHSSSHGAGRKLSRGAAKKLFTVEDLVAQTAGIECRKDTAVLDEIPGCYKDIDAVMAAQVELTEPLHTLKQVLCIKG